MRKVLARSVLPVCLVLVTGGALFVFADPLETGVSSAASRDAAANVTPYVAPQSDCCKCTQIRQLPYRITRSGAYCVVATLSGAAGISGITIEVSDVTLDLCGFTLIGGPGSFTGIQLLSGVENVTIINGTVRDWGGTGIDGLPGSRLRYDELFVLNNGGGGLQAGSNCIITNSRVIGSGVRGILAMEGTLIKNCVVKGNSAHALQTGGGGCTIMDSICEGNLANGFFSNGANTFVNCTAQGNGGVGFTVGGGSTMTNCTATGNGGDGIRMDLTGTLTNCTSSYNGIHGIEGAAYATIRGCTAIGNAEAGFQLTNDFNRLEDNHASNNNIGFQVIWYGNVIAKNSACGNTTNYAIAPGNQVGTLTNDPGVAGAWANLDCSVKDQP